MKWASKEAWSWHVKMFWDGTWKSKSKKRPKPNKPSVANLLSNKNSNGFSLQKKGHLTWKFMKIKVFSHFLLVCYLTSMYSQSGPFFGECGLGWLCILPPKLKTALTISLNLYLFFFNLFSNLQSMCKAKVCMQQQQCSTD